MPNRLFIGGPIDGDWQEIPEDRQAITVPDDDANLHTYVRQTITDLSQVVIPIYVHYRTTGIMERLLKNYRPVKSKRVDTDDLDTFKLPEPCPSQLDE